MAVYKKVPGRKTVNISTLEFDETPTPGSLNPVTSGGVAESVSQQSSNIAEAFSAFSTYAIGEVVIGPDGKLYQCTTAVDTAGEWDPEDWDETSIGGLLSNGIVKYTETKTFHVGDNIVSASTTVDMGSNWSGDFENGFVHTSGVADEIEFEQATESGKGYLIEFDIAGSGEGAVGVAIGSSHYCDSYNGKTHRIVGVISDGGHVKIKAMESGVSATITNVLVRKVQETGTEVVFASKNVNNGQTMDDITGFWNVAIGPDVQRYNQNGTRNIAIGNMAQNRLKTGSRNISIGTFAMPFVEEGDNNIAIGADTIYSSVSRPQYKASNNVAIGKATMSDGENLQYNVAICASAMGGCDKDAAHNVCIGHQAGNYAHEGNVCIGRRSGYYTKGNNNTFVGNQSGNALYVTGNGNICIGNQASFDSTGASSSDVKTISNSIVIGSDVKTTKSNQIVIGKDVHELVICGKKIKFNNDNTVTWEELS